MNDVFEPVLLSLPKEVGIRSEPLVRREAQIQMAKLIGKHYLERLFAYLAILTSPLGYGLENARWDWAIQCVQVLINT